MPKNDALLGTMRAFLLPAQLASSNMLHDLHKCVYERFVYESEDHPQQPDGKPFPSSPDELGQRCGVQQEREDLQSAIRRADRMTEDDEREFGVVRTLRQVGRATKMVYVVVHQNAKHGREDQVQPHRDPGREPKVELADAVVARSDRGHEHRHDLGVDETQTKIGVPGIEGGDDH
ncbi:hypothetical protein DACRYDRAFT_20631 [Dacryopinax primogenitus]|uniref:Uncharacterized protein n=1 Tax=Dacryopinax primogenitus (strain DJM 731) TaxID=1858805 RepID=M5G8L0_DACPD|nr:uncharacterized protein DACRYDRAFT_20631 [Dacryopinax primogenitus]EJU05084.1 hypothetical protein DACRYDRAFT_20631 [Dacryopinax primogenitus]